MGRINGVHRRGLVVAFGVAMALISATAASGATATHSWYETTSPHVSGNASEIYAMVATGVNDVWAFGYDRANLAGTFEWRVLGERWNGSTWVRLNTLDRETAPAHDFIYGATASGPNDVWIVGQSDTAPANQVSRNLVEHWNGSAWSIDNTVPDPGVRRGLLAASADSADDVWAVGDATFPGADYNAQVLHRAAGTWTQVPFAVTVPGCNAAERGELDAVDAISPTDVYVSGWCQSQPIGRERGYVAHWNGASWSLVLRADGASELTELATAPDGEIWVAGRTNFRGNNDAIYPLVFHGSATDGFTAVPVRHSSHFGGPVDALTVTDAGVVISGQLSNTPDGNPTQTFALRLRASDGTWVKEPVNPFGGAYGRAHAAAAEPGGTLWIGGTSVGGTHLDVQAFMARRSRTQVCRPGATAGGAHPFC